MNEKLLDVKGLSAIKYAEITKAFGKSKFDFELGVQKVRRHSYFFSYTERKMSKKALT